MSEQWQIGKQKKSGIAQKEEKAILVGLVRRGQDRQVVEEYLDELEFLAKTAGAQTVKTIIQQLDHPNSRTFIGEGKAQEIAEYIENYEVDLVIFDDDLTAKEIRSCISF